MIGALESSSMQLHDLWQIIWVLAVFLLPKVRLFNDVADVSSSSTRIVSSASGHIATYEIHFEVLEGTSRFRVSMCIMWPLIFRSLTSDLAFTVASIRLEPSPNTMV